MVLDLLRNRALFRRIVEPHRADVYRFLLWLCHDPTRADDAVQETFLRAWRALDSLHDVQAARPWLLTIARRELARTFQGQSNTVSLDALYVEDPGAMYSDSDDVDDMRRAIKKLELAYREPLILQIWFGHTTQEIAEIMQLGQPAVLTRLHRARQKLQILWETESAPRYSFKESSRKTFSAKNIVSTKNTVDSKKSSASELWFLKKSDK